jgi:hypothetical protein
MVHGLNKIRKMNIDIKYIEREYFSDSGKIWKWVFYFKKYNHIKGFNLRLFGVHFNIRERRGTEKLIEMLKIKGK